MVKSTAGELDLAFAALADPTRRGLVAALAERPHTVGDLAAPLPMSLVAVTKHLGVLERAGLVRRRRAGRHVICALAPEPLREAAAWLDGYRTFWTDRIDALESYLTKEDS